MLKSFYDFINEQESQSMATPAITGLTIMQNRVTPAAGKPELANVSGVLTVANCESPTGGYIVNGRKYDVEKVKAAIEEDTKIRVACLSPGDTQATILIEAPQPNNNLAVNVDFPKSKIPNLSGNTQFFVLPIKGGQSIKIDGKPIRVQCEGFMLVDSI